LKYTYAFYFGGFTVMCFKCPRMVRQTEACNMYWRN